MIPPAAGELLTLGSLAGEQTALMWPIKDKTLGAQELLEGKGADEAAGSTPEGWIWDKRRWFGKQTLLGAASATNVALTHLFTVLSSGTFPN